MHSLNGTCRHRIPILDKRPQSLRMKNETGSVQGHQRIATSKESKNAPCTLIHSHNVPVAVQDEHGIWIKLRDEEIHVSARLESWFSEICATVQRSVSCREQ